MNLNVCAKPHLRRWWILRDEWAEGLWYPSRQDVIWVTKGLGRIPTELERGRNRI